jgi:hypothetical protein
MAVPSSGPLELWNDIWNSEIGGTQGNNSLHSASVYAGFSTPDAMSDFYGWSDVEVPTVTTNAATSVGDSSMTANGNVSATGNENPTRGFYFGTNSSAATNNPKYSIGIGGTGAFSRSFTGLNYNTTYHMWAFACNSAGEATGARVGQTTPFPSFSPTQGCFSGYDALWCTDTSSGTGTINNYSGYVNPYTGGAVALHTGCYFKNGRLCSSGRFAQNATAFVGSHVNAPADVYRRHCANRVCVAQGTVSSITFTNNGPYRDQSCTFPDHSNGGVRMGLQATSFIPSGGTQDLLRWTPSDIRLKTNINYL